MKKDIKKFLWCYFDAFMGGRATELSSFQVKETAVMVYGTATFFRQTFFRQTFFRGTFFRGTFFQNMSKQPPF